MKKNIKIRKLIDQLFIPILIITIVLIASALITYYAGIKGDNDTFIKAFINWFDLNQSGNAAIWLSVLIWLICGMSFSMLGLSKKINSKISKKNGVFLIIIGLIVCLVSIKKISNFI